MPDNLVLAFTRSFTRIDTYQHTFFPFRKIFFFIKKCPMFFVITLRIGFCMKALQTNSHSHIERCQWICKNGYYYGIKCFQLKGVSRTRKKHFAKYNVCFLRTSIIATAQIFDLKFAFLPVRLFLNLKLRATRFQKKAWKYLRKRARPP